MKKTTYHYEAYILWEDGTWTVEGVDVTSACAEAEDRGILALKKRFAGTGKLETIFTYFCGRKGE